MNERHFYKGWVWAVFVALDQLGNALAGGHPDVTVSARLAWLADSRGRPWFRFVEDLVDWAFYPADGPGHCWKSYLREDADKIRRGNDAGLALLTGFVLVLILPLRITNSLRGWT